MQYEGLVIRPPSEAHSIILQVTVGCSYNQCTFCGAYKEKSFKTRTSFLTSDLEFAKKYCRRQTRVFLADGDALILPQKQLVHILQEIRIQLPWVNRVSLYANCRAIRSKSEQELAELRELGLDRVYLGLESGDNQTLARIKKGETQETMIEAAGKIRQCNLYLSVTVLLGIAGEIHSQQHAHATANALNLMKPNQIAALTLMPLDNTPLYDEIRRGEFNIMGAKLILLELKMVLEKLTLEKVLFSANHASNYLNLSGRLPHKTKHFLQQIDDALQGKSILREERLRAL